jgi:hypothetical protein
MHSAHPVLGIPELIAAILEHLDRASLATAMRVCGAWRDLAVRLLWRAPAEIHLVHVPPHRRGLYAPAIRELVVLHDDDVAYKQYLPAVGTLLFGDDSDGLDFRRDDIHHDAGSSMPSLTQWQFSRLQRLDFAHCACLGLTGDCDPLAALLQRCGPSLAHVMVACCPWGKCSSHRSLYDPSAFTIADRCAYTALSAAALRELACREALVELGAFMVPRRRSLLAVAADVPRPFPALRALSISLPSASALRPLVALLTTNTAGSSRLTQLTISVDCDGTPSLQPLLRLASSLRELHLVFREDRPPHLMRRDVRTLAELSHLRSLSFKNFHGHPSDHLYAGQSESDREQDPADEAEGQHEHTPAAGDDDVLALLAQLPHLRSLWFDVVGRFTADAPVQLGLRCPQLERLCLRAPMDLEAWKRVQTPLFPALTELSLDGVRDVVVTGGM